MSAYIEGDDAEAPITKRAKKLPFHSEKSEKVYLRREKDLRARDLYGFFPFEGENEASFAHRETFADLATDINKLAIKRSTASVEELEAMLARIEANHHAIPEIPPMHYGFTPRKKDTNYGGEKHDILKMGGDPEKGVRYDRYEAMHRFDRYWELFNTQLQLRKATPGSAPVHEIIDLT